MLLSHLVVAAILATAVPLAVEAETQHSTAEVAGDRLGEVLQLDALFAVLREEGLAHGATLELDLFPSGGGGEWKDAVSAIYDTSRLQAGFDAVMSEQLGPDLETVDAIVEFFGSDLGRKIVGLEIEARRAFLDTAAEEAARVAADDAAAARDPKVAQVRRMIEAADLVEMNVAGSMSGNLAFMTGMAGTGAYGSALPEDQILSDVWAQEEQVRADTSTWLYAYLGLAYAPLSKEEMDAYIEFWESPAGKRLNAALFTAFDRVFRQVSFELGRAAGQAMQGRDI